MSKATATATATKRDPAQEAKARSIMMMGLLNAQLIAAFTKTKDDDRIVAYLMAAVTDPARWAELADAIWGPLS